MSEASERKEKQKWAIEKPKLDNTRKLLGIYFIDPDDEELKDIMKNARRKMPAALTCKTQREKYRETCRVEKKTKTKYACIVEATNLRGSAWKDLFTSIMKIILQEKAWIHYVTTI